MGRMEILFLRLKDRWLTWRRGPVLMKRVAFNRYTLSRNRDILDALPKYELKTEA